MESNKVVLEDGDLALWARRHHFNDRVDVGQKVRVQTDIGDCFVPQKLDSFDFGNLIHVEIQHLQVGQVSPSQSPNRRDLI